MGPRSGEEPKDPLPHRHSTIARMSVLSLQSGKKRGKPMLPQYLETKKTSHLAPRKNGQSERLPLLMALCMRTTRTASLVCPIIIVNLAVTSPSTKNRCPVTQSFLRQITRTNHTSHPVAADETDLIHPATQMTSSLSSWMMWS